MNNRHLDLFSGIGGFALAARWSGWQTIGFAEVDPYASAVLKKHWPDVPNYGDVRNLIAADIGTVDLITGGFPCQPFSTASAGKRKGKNDHRYLWPQMLRIIESCRPRWVLCENVAGIEGVSLEEMVSDLESVGYQTAPPLRIPACAFGFDHVRKRIWIIAHTDSNSEFQLPINAKVAVLPQRGYDPGIMGKTNGFAGGMDRLRRKAIGNAIVPQVAAEIMKAMMHVQMQFQAE